MQYIFFTLSCSSSGTSTIEKTTAEPATEDTALVQEPSSPGDTGADDTSTVEPVILGVSFLAPQDQISFEQGQEIVFQAVVEGTENSEGPYQVVWESNLDGILFEEEREDVSTLDWSSSDLSLGKHSIYLRVTAANGATGSAVRKTGICGWTLIDDFSSEIDTSQWLLHQDAYRDSRGWLEMTGNAQGKKGAIFYTGTALQPGDLTIRFDISTGQCDDPDVSCSPFTCDADGFAMSVYKTNTTTDLETLLEETSAGGGLGYAYSGESCSTDTDCPAGTVCTNGTCETQSFHIEFDTWYNPDNDPTALDHIGIMLNGDRSNHYLYSEVTDLEDNLWHEIIVRIRGINVETEMDGSLVISGTIPPLNFKGGYVGFSGTTGSCINYHRFDNLYIQPICDF